MKRFEITLSYSKVIDAMSEEDAQSIIDRIERDSPLADEYGPFDTLDSWTQVEEVKD